MLMDWTVGEMGERKRKSIRGTGRKLLAVVWLRGTAVFTIPAPAQQPDAPLPNGGTPPASADDPTSPPTNADPEAMFPHFRETRFWLSGQMNFIFQAHPSFHANYSGQNSLSPHYEKATSRVMTFYTG